MHEKKRYFIELSTIGTRMINSDKEYIQNIKKKLSKLSKIRTQNLGYNQERTESDVHMHKSMLLEGGHQSLEGGH